jgi:CO/xanthine dehydrogenase Mo-binding subunit
MGTWTYAWGDLDAARRASTLVVKNTYAAPFAHHFAIETYAAIALPRTDGVAVLSTIQHPFIERRVIAEMLGLSPSSVDVRAVDMGGSFGGKGYSKVAPAAAFFSRLIGRPLKIVLNSEESFVTGQREAAEIAIETGFDREHRVTFQVVDADFLIGAYADISERVVAKSALFATGPYRTPAALVRARAIFTSTPPTTAFRGFGAPHFTFALEGQMSEAAHRIGTDPSQLRTSNMKRQGEPLGEHETRVDGDWIRLVESARDAMGWTKPTAAGRGRGIAFGMKSCIPGTTSNARVSLHADGTVTAYVGTSEIGQGAVTAFTRLVADGLGTEPADVTLVMGDTASGPFDALTASSRSLVHMGNALLNAVEGIKHQVLETIHESRDPDAKRLEMRSDRISAGRWSGSLLDVMAMRSGLTRRELSATGSFTAAQDERHPLGGPTPFYEAVATAAELSVDDATGMIHIHKIAHVTDAGKVHDHLRARGLDEGGLVMGLGLALSEQLIYDRGHLRNGSSLDYRIPTVCDLPDEMVSLFQENEDGPGPGGAKGLAEGGLLAIAPAIAAAILDCTGVHIRELPFTPERVWRAITDRAGSAPAAQMRSGKLNEPVASSAAGSMLSAAAVVPRTNGD